MRMSLPPFARGLLTFTFATSNLRAPLSVPGPCSTQQWFRSGRSCQLALLLFIATAAHASANVVLIDDGASVALSNGVVSAVITKSNGRCIDLRMAGGNNLLTNGGQFYFDANGSTYGGSSVYVTFTPETYRVVTNTPQRVEIALTDTNLTGFNAELHYVMRSGDSGFYVYTLWRHGVGDPPAMLEQSRMVLRCDPNVFNRAWSSTDKFGQMIEPSLLKTNPTIMDATYQLPLTSSYTNATGFTENGYPVYTKYDWCDYMENHSIEGLAGDNVGLWLLFGSVEYFNGGPTKPNLLLHGTDTTPLLLWDFHAQHFGGAVVNQAANGSWNKIMGPCFVYVNSGTNNAELWADAQRQADAERSAWPYNWVNETNYPLARGTVRGTLHITGQSTSNALLVLAQPGAYWQLQSEGYQFWTRAAADGSFTIPNVRPGAYSLFARVPGAVGEFALPNVVVAPDATNDLGWLNWNPPRRERRLWRIGTPDLSAGEFRFGSDMRQFGLWWRYLEEMGTNDLVYQVGGSATTDWYYAQSVVAMDDGTYFCPAWKVEFVLTNLPPAPAVLTIDLAGGVGGTLLTTINGASLANISITNDGSIYRSATRSGLFRHFELSFNPDLLQLGTNRVAFTISKPSPWTNSTSVKPVYPGRGVMYDCVQLEAGALLTNPAPRFTRIDRAGSTLTFRGSGGIPDGVFEVLATGNPTTPASNWTHVATNWFDLNGDFQFGHTLVPETPLTLYRLQLP